MSKLSMVAQIETRAHEAVNKMAKNVPRSTIQSIHRVLLAHAAEQTRKAFEPVTRP